MMIDSFVGYMYLGLYYLFVHNFTLY